MIGLPAGRQSQINGTSESWVPGWPAVEQTGQTGARDERVCVDCAFRVGVVPRAHDTIRLRSGSGSGSGFRAGCHRRCRHCTASVQENGCSSSIPACVCARSPKEGRCPVDGRACGHTSGSPGLILILILIPTWPLIPFSMRAVRANHRRHLCELVSSEARPESARTLAESNSSRVPRHAT